LPIRYAGTNGLLKTSPEAYFQPRPLCAKLLSPIWQDQTFDLVTMPYKQFKPPAIHLQGAFFYLANSMLRQVDILNNLILCQFQRLSARRDSQFARRPIARIAHRPKMRKAP